MIADEPDEVGEVRSGGLVDDELEHGLLFDTVDVESEGPDGDANHALAVVEELDRLRVQRKVVRVLERGNVNKKKLGFMMQSEKKFCCAFSPR